MFDIACFAYVCMTLVVLEFIVMHLMLVAKAFPVRFVLPVVNACPVRFVLPVVNAWLALNMFSCCLYMYTRNTKNKTFGPVRMNFYYCRGWGLAIIVEELLSKGVHHKLGWDACFQTNLYKKPNEFCKCAFLLFDCSKRIPCEVCLACVVNGACLQ